MKEGLLHFFTGIGWPSIIIGAVIGALIPGLFKWVLSFFKNHRDKYHISLSCGESHTYKSMSKGDVTVSLHYKDDVYDGTLSVLEINLVNDGLNDISYANHFEKPILIKSSSFKIIDAEYVGDSKIKANVVRTSEGIIQVSWGLLKKDERIIIRLAGEKKFPGDGNAESTDSFFDSLSFNVRSDCVDYIAPRKMPFKYFVAVSTVMVLLFGLIQYWTTDKKSFVGEEYSFCYEGNEVRGSLTYDKDSDIYIIHSPDSINHQIHLLDFKKHPKVTISVVRNPVAVIIILYAAIWLIMLLVGAVVVLSQKGDKNRKIFEE